MSNNSLFKTYFVAIAVCAVCATLVSTANVVLRPIIEQNKLNFKRGNIVLAADLVKPGYKASDIAPAFEKIDPQVYDLLKEKFVTARKYGRESNVINNLVKPSCLIIDEIGRCVFDRESTGMFFDLIDRRYEKEGSNCMIFTSNKQPNDWLEFFRCDDDLKAALDRLFDDAKVITFKGESYRGRKREVLAVEAGETALHSGK